MAERLLKQGDNLVLSPCFVYSISSRLSAGKACFFGRVRFSALLLCVALYFSFTVIQSQSNGILETGYSLFMYSAVFKN